MAESMRILDWLLKYQSIWQLVAISCRFHPNSVKARRVLKARAMTVAGLSGWAGQGWHTCSGCSKLPCWQPALSWFTNIVEFRSKLFGREAPIVYW